MVFNGNDPVGPPGRVVVVGDPHRLRGRRDPLLLRLQVDLEDVRVSSKHCLLPGEKQNQLFLHVSTMGFMESSRTRLFR